jgi:Uma2 family endonuclease
MSVSPVEPNTIDIDISHIVIEDDTPVDNFFSAKLQRLLVESLYNSAAELPLRKHFLADANVGVFYSLHQPPLVPDVFLSLDVEVPSDFKQKKNRTYFVWELGKSPDVVIEIVSNQEGNELGTKLEKYARMGVTYYAIFDPIQQLGESLLQVFGLFLGRYHPLEVTRVEPENDRVKLLYWLEEVGIGLTLWEGVYESKQETWLRWCDRQGVVIPTGAERVEQERLRAEQERLRAEQAEQQIEHLQQEKQETIARLLNLGLTQEQVAEALNLSLEDIRLTSDSD